MIFEWRKKNFCQLIICHIARYIDYFNRKKFHRQKPRKCFASIISYHYNNQLISNFRLSNPFNDYWKMNCFKNLKFNQWWIRGISVNFILKMKWQKTNKNHSYLSLKFSINFSPQLDLKRTNKKKNFKLFKMNKVNKTKQRKLSFFSSLLLGVESKNNRS